MGLTLRDIKNADGLIRVARPIPWEIRPSVTPASRLALEYVYNPSYIPNANSQAVRGFNAVANNNVIRVARPFPFTATSKAVGLGQGYATVGKEAAVAAQALQGTARAGRVATLLRPVAGAAARFGGAIERLPVVGRVLTKVPVLGRLMGPLMVVSTITSILDIMQSQAPGVQGWLLGGWRGPGYGQMATASELNPTIGLDLSEQAGVQYSIRLFVDFISPPETADLGTYAIFSSITMARTYLDGDRWYMDFAGRNGETPIQTLHSGVVGLAQGSKAYLKIYRNGVEMSPQGTVQRPDIVTNPHPSAPSQTPNNPANAAKNAGIAAAAATIAAGKLQPTLRRSPNPKNNRRIAPIPDPNAPKPSTGTSTQPCKGNQCGQAGLDATKGVDSKLDDLLQYLQTLGLADTNKIVRRIDEKVGAQIFDDRGNKTGLAGAALKTIERVNKVSDYLRFDRITNVMTLAVTVHNAAMLSNQLEQTLMSAISNSLAAIGIKDSENNPLDINKIVGQSVENIVKGAIGAENYAALTINWKKANRIYQASANLLNNLQSLRYSITGALETIGGMNAKVGNALKKYGVLGDNAYPWFNPSPNYDNKFMRGIEVAETTVSSIDSVASEILSAQDSVKQIGEQKTELEKAIKEGTEKPGVDNTQQKEKATAAKTASKSPDVNPEDLVKPGGI
jgi:hypothetical protein